ncbi:hypothetical protein ACOZ38_27035 [Sphaerisporangium viridialbum]
MGTPRTAPGQPGSPRATTGRAAGHDRAARSGSRGRRGGEAGARP